MFIADAVFDDEWVIGGRVGQLDALLKLLAFFDRFIARYIMQDRQSLIGLRT